MLFRSGQEAEIIHVRRRRDRQKAANLGPPHQKLHSDPRAKAEARDTGRLRLGMDRLYPVERRRGVAEFADAIVERSLAADDAAKVEAQHCENARDEAFVHRLGDAVVHRSAALWMRMQEDRKRKRLNSSP